MQKFTRIHHAGQGGTTRPQSAQSRVYGEAVSMGEPLVLHGDTEIRRQIETSLEIVAKERLLEAENQATTLVEQARAEAARILEKANAQAKEMVGSAQEQSDKIRETAHEEGFKAGFQEGYGDATEQVQQETIELLQGAQVLAEGAYAAERRILKDFEKHAARLIEYIVNRIVERELSQAPETILPMIERAIESLYLSGKVKVVVSAQIIQDLRQFTERSRDALESMSRFEFVADSSLEPNQLYIIGQEGSFDISPEARIHQLMAPIEQHLTLPRPEETGSASPEAVSEERNRSNPPEATDHPLDYAREPQDDNEQIAPDGEPQDTTNAEAIPPVNLAPDEWLEVDVNADPFDDGAES
jgi:flagellar assembly protein FliH